MKAPRRYPSFSRPTTPLSIHVGKQHSTVSYQDGAIRYSTLTCILDHMVHHLLALWALGASPHEIQNMWNYNETYQSSLETDDAKASSSKNLRDPAVFNQCLGDNNCYATFLRFFEDEVAEKGIPAVVQEYMLQNDDRAKTIFCRMFSGEQTQHTYFQ
jgi:hypothetical protein